MLETPVERATVAFLKPTQSGILPFLDSVLEKQAAQCGRDEKSKQQCAEHGESYGPCHGPEQTALHPLQGENRKIGNDDNNAGEEHGPLHFVCRRGDHLLDRLLAAAGFGVTQDVLYHHYRTIYYHAEIECPQR